MSNAAPRSDWRFAALIIVGVTLWRLLALGHDRTDLWVDEAQYWLWGQHLDWGYFSKPPMIAFLLRAVTDLAGSDSTFWIRSPGAVLHALTAVLIGLSGTRMFTPRIGAWAAVFYVTAPFVTLGSWLMTTDTVMLPFYAAALYAYLRLRDTRSNLWAILFGAALGAGILSKYAAIYLPLSVLVAAVLIPTARIAGRDALVAAATALIVASPNLIWNASNGGTTLRHIADDNAKVGTSAFDILRAGDFLASQFVVFGPILFAALVYAVWKLLGRRAVPGTALFAALTFPALVLMTGQAARVGANANWAVTAFVTGSVLAALTLADHRRWRFLAVGLNLTIAALLPLLFVFPERLPTPIADRFTGPRALSVQIEEAARAEGLNTILAERRGVLADLFHTLDGKALTIYAPRPDGQPHNYYEQVFALPDELPADLLHVTRRAPRCATARLISDITPDNGIYQGLTFHLYRVPPNCFGS